MGGGVFKKQATNIETLLCSAHNNFFPVCKIIFF